MTPSRTSSISAAVLALSATCAIKPARAFVRSLASDLVASVKETASSKRQEQLAVIAAIKAKVGPASFRFTDKQLLRLVEMCGSVGLACDCLCMVPRPFWLERWEAEVSS
jgi:hypothetical protein